MLAALAAALALLATRSPRPPEAHIILASVTLTGTGTPNGAAPPPPPPPPSAQFFFPTGTDLILAAATF